LQRFGKGGYCSRHQAGQDYTIRDLFKQGRECLSSGQLNEIRWVISNGLEQYVGALIDHRSGINFIKDGSALLKFAHAFHQGRHAVKSRYFQVVSKRFGLACSRTSTSNQGHENEQLLPHVGGKLHTPSFRDEDLQASHCYLETS
jgi:hypothetical protein